MIGSAVGPSETPVLRFAVKHAFALTGNGARDAAGNEFGVEPEATAGEVWVPPEVVIPVTYSLWLA